MLFPAPFSPTNATRWPAFDRTIDSLIDHFFPIALGRALELQDLPPARRGEGEFKLDPFGIALHFNHLDLLKLLDARLNLAGFVRLVAETIDEGLNPCDFFRLAPRCGLTLGVPLGRSRWNDV